MSGYSFAPIDKRLRLGFKHNLLARDLAQSAMCYYDSTNNGLIDARFFYLILRVIKEHFPYFGLGVEQDAMYKPLSMKAIKEIPMN